MEIHPLSTVGGHRPVMASKVLEALALPRGGRVVDGTAGLGGHTRLLAQEVGPEGKVWAFEKDPASREHLQDRLAEFPQVEIVPRSYHEMLDVVGVSRVHGVLLDLGISSFLLENSGRGFSFRRMEEVLDMRFDPEAGQPLYQRWIHLTPDRVGRILRTYGEVPGWRKLGRAIHRAKPRTVRELNDVILQTSPRGGVQLLRKVYQAFRIWVNDELCVLRRGLEAAWKALLPGGRLVVLSYHSLEDRCVKHMRQVPGVDVLFPRGLRPSPEEIRINPRARSARMRAFVKREVPREDMDDWHRYLAGCPCGV